MRVTILVPVVRDVGPPGHVPVAAKLAAGPEIPRVATAGAVIVALLPVTHHVVIRDGDELALVGPAQSRNLAAVAADERCSVADNGNLATRR